jgi:hypothetical protein
MGRFGVGVRTGRKTVSPPFVWPPVEAPTTTLSPLAFLVAAKSA